MSDDKDSGGEESRNTERPAPDKSHDWATSAAPACLSTEETVFPPIQGDDTFSMDTPEALLIGTNIAESCSSVPVSHAYQDTLLQGCSSQTFELYDDANTLVNHTFNHPAGSTETVQLDIQQSQPSVNVDSIVSHGALHGHGGFHSTYSPMLMGPMSLHHETHYESALSSHLDCLIKILRRGGIATQYTRYVDYLIACWSTFLFLRAIHRSAPQLLNDMLDGFLEECWPCMKRWYSITDSYTTVRWVLWWQISQTSEALDDIPETNTPTPVQRALPHPRIIDWVPFASIRNALIISEGYDIDQVFCDMTEAFVLQKEESGSQINEIGGVAYKTVVSLLQSALRSAVVGNGSDSGHGNNVEAEDVFSDGPLKRTKAASSAYCQQLINFGRWVLKLDPSFFQKYPGLYDSTVVASGPSWVLLNSPKIQRPKPLDAEAMNTYANLLLKDQNYRTYGMDSRLKHNNWRSNRGLDQWREV